MDRVIDYEGYTPVILCDCGDEEITCWDFTNECTVCGREYNFAGQMLAQMEYTQYELDMGFDN